MGHLMLAMGNVNVQWGEKTISSTLADVLVLFGDHRTNGMFPDVMKCGIHVIFHAIYYSIYLA